MQIKNGETIQMTQSIRRITRQDAETVFQMMRVFYDSPAVLVKSSDEVLRRDIADCLDGNRNIDGYVFVDDGKTVGYAMIAHSYSTEYGGKCLWVEDIYLTPECRGKGFGTQFFAFIEEQYKGQAVRIRLEAEVDNVKAIEVYTKCGYHLSPYAQLTKEL